VGSGISRHEGTIGDAVKRLAALPLLFQPGDAWEDSLADDVLGRLVEVVAGMPFDQFLQQRLFQPLGMKDTYFFPPEDKVSRLVAAYANDEQKGLQPILDNQVMGGQGGFQYTADYPYRGPHTYFSGGGGLCSTAEDYYRFCQMMLNGGELNGVRILSRKSVELMSQNHVQGKTDLLDYGLGFGTQGEPQQLTELGSVGSYYWGGFYYTTFVIDPKEDLIAIFLGQMNPSGGLNLDSKAITLAYQAIKD
jgi:CubicO group peptidase (beta-lactamase class C family)